MREDYLNGNSQTNPEEKEFERALRPLSFSDFTGQQKVVENIKICHGKLGVEVTDDALQKLCSRCCEDDVVDVEQ